MKWISSKRPNTAMRGDVQFARGVTVDKAFIVAHHRQGMQAIATLTTLTGIIVMAEADLLARITVNPNIFGGKPIIRGRRLAVEHILGMLAAGDSAAAIADAYPYLEPEDIQACLVFARRLVARERVEPAIDLT